MRNQMYRFSIVSNLLKGKGKYNIHIYCDSLHKYGRNNTEEYYPTMLFLFIEIIL